MKWEQVGEQTCSIARSLAIVGDTWTLLIIRQIFMKVRRFSAIQQSLGITKHRLTDRLNRLVDEDILYKERYGENHERYEYKLTERGLDLYPVLLSLTKWGDTWLSDADGAPVEYFHKRCGHNAKPVLTCSHCHEELKANETELTIGPALKAKLERGEVSEQEKQLYASVLAPKAK